MGNDTLIPIPRMEGRITKRKDGYIELILERHYDREARQTRNRKTIIGQDFGILPGMMIPNDNYYELFDAHGCLNNDPMKAEEQPEEPYQKEEQTAEPTEQTKTDSKTEQPTEPTKAHSETEQQHPRQPTQEDKTMPEDNLKERERALQDKDVQLRLREIALKQMEAALIEKEQDLKRQEEKLYIKKESEDTDHIKLLDHLLDRYIETVQHQAKRKPDASMTQKQIQTINEVLSELKDFFTGSESDNLLHLAEEPDPDHDIPGTTNGEMDLLLSAYHITLSAFLYSSLRAKKSKKT